ncbi:MAG: coenzyme F420-0:L-glutamate ligase [Ktedonobacterales bacterium]|nr:coenzyme F420-0:L-glutamate ligase [Ktedonobacterales bacterium]
MTGASEPRASEPRASEPSAPQGRAEVRLIGLRGVPEVVPGMDVAQLVRDAADATGEPLHSGDILVVTHKVISKAEGQLVDLRTVEPSDLARRYAAAWQKDPRQVELVLRESRRIVRMARGLIIAETHHGFICANAGVDLSNVAGEDVACLLPRDPDGSARTLRAALAERLGVEVAVIISDSFGRPWRWGITNIAIGAAGLAPLTDYRGQPDDHGRMMSASVLAVADELAAAAELVMGKVSRCPFALIRGYSYERRDGQASELVMDAAADLFR